MRNNKYSDLKIIAFPEKVQSFREGRITAPIYVRVKPINRCQHGCFFCTYSDGSLRALDREDHVDTGMHADIKEKDILPWPKLQETLDDFKELGVKAVTYSGGGEPLLYAQIVEAMQRTLNFRIDLSIITNGQLLKGPRAEVLAYARWVRVSVDYTNAEQMKRSRNVPEHFFDQVLDNIKNFAAIKQRDCDLGVNYIIHQSNADGLVDFAERLKDIGVENVRFSPMWVPGIAGYHASIREKVERQLIEAQRLVDERFTVNSTFDLTSPAHAPVRKYNRCYFMQTVPVVGADQCVYACHNKAYDNTGKIGSIAQQRFKELWFSDEAKAVFEGLNPICDCRHQCANDNKNRHIQNLVASSNDNFV
jgi:MoaA/NifB/PqqE/SkfB family radical SAM enzyme